MVCDFSRMNAETEAETHVDDDIQTRQSDGTLVFDHQLLCQQHAVKIQHIDYCDETSIEILNKTAVTDICSGATLGEIDDYRPSSEGDLEIQSLTHCSNIGNSHASAELKATDLLTIDSDIVVKDAATECCCILVDSAQDDKSSSGCLPAQQTLSDECYASATDGLCECDDCSQQQPVSVSECCDCYRATAETNQLDNVSSSTDLGQCFMLSQPDSHCSSTSLQDAFMQFLKKKQVS